MRLRSLTSTAPTEHEEAEAVREFARLAGTGLAQLEQDDLGDRSLVLVFAMSAWVRCARTGVAGACASLLRLRHLVLECSDLDRVSEPVPLLAGEPRTALLGLAVYVHGLVSRAAKHSGRSKSALIEEALALLD